jgi:hypothetical protein
MFAGRLVFSQLMDFLPKHEFNKCVRRYQGSYRVRKFSCLDQFLCMAFAQLTSQDSLRGIEACLRAVQPKLYHMGIRARVSRSTLADANERRDWRIYADLAQVLIGIARPLYASEELGVDLDQTVYALDSTTIDLCLSLFPWARFRKKKGGIKLHTLLDLRGNIPALVRITDALVHDVNILDEIIAEPGSFYLMDRAYLDFARLYLLNQCLAFFVARARGNFRFRRLYSHPVDRANGLLCDQTVVPVSFYPAHYYPEKLRRIRYRDPQTGKRLVFLTNCFDLPASSIAGLYKLRWQAELFFKWIKQHLRIKSFYGTSQNAVKTQVWTAISTYVLVAILKKRLRLDASLYTILQILSVTLFEKMPIQQALTTSAYRTDDLVSRNQLLLFDL